MGCLIVICNIVASDVCKYSKHLSIYKLQVTFKIKMGLKFFVQTPLSKRTTFESITTTQMSYFLSLISTSVVSAIAWSPQCEIRVE